MKSNEAIKKKNEDNAADVLAGGSQPSRRHLSLSAEELDRFYYYMSTLVTLTYIPRSTCAVPASGAVWFVPALSSDTGTWLGLR